MSSTTTTKASTTKATATAKKVASKKPATKKDLPPTVDLQMESLLTEMGFFYELEPGVLLTEFDRAASLRNQARTDPLDNDLAEGYATAMRNGSVFPALVAWEKSDKEPLIIVDGNHRYAALQKLGRGETDTYIIRNADPSKITILTMLANARHGKATSPKERLAQGVYMVDRGATIKEAAFILGIKDTLLTAEVNKGKADMRAIKVGIDRLKWDKLPGGIRARLNQIQTNEVFREMSKLTIDAKLSGEDFTQTIAQLQQMRGFQEQMDYVNSLREVFAHQIQPGGALDKPGHGRQGNSPQRVFRMMLGQARSIPSGDEIVQHMTEHDREELASQTEHAIQKLNQILELLRS